MHLIIIGCEYTGKTTLAAEIQQWMEKSMGGCESSFHDHFFPWDPADTSPKAKRIEVDLKLLTLNDPQVVEKYTRYVTYYHTNPSFYAKQDHCVVNWYYGDTVYGPLYYGFGGPGEVGDRQVMARKYDSMIVQNAPDTVLVLMKADADVIRRRRSAMAQPQPFPREEDIELVQGLFESEFESSLIGRRIVLDTSSTATAQETLGKFVEQIQPHLAAADRERIRTHLQE